MTNFSLQVKSSPTPVSYDLWFKNGSYTFKYLQEENRKNKTSHCIKLYDIQISVSVRFISTQPHPPRFYLQLISCYNKGLSGCDRLWGYKTGMFTTWLFRRLTGLHWNPKTSEKCPLFMHLSVSAALHWKHLWVPLADLGHNSWLVTCKVESGITLMLVGTKHANIFTSQ